MTLAEKIELACLLEATAKKPGNVHPKASFEDLCYQDFVLAAAAIANPLADVRSVGLGRSIFNSVQATRTATGTNVNLGIALLLAPLAAIPEDQSLPLGIAKVLEGTTIDDAELAYSAIRLAQPGGMGEASAQDLRDRPTVTLRDVMALAANRDRIAEQYVTNFQLVFNARSKLCELIEASNDWEQSVITLHVWMMSRWSDTLIARKCGQAVASEATARASDVMATIREDGILEAQRLDDFDSWLRADKHRRNPGTTADLVAATLFATLRDGLVALPSREEISFH